MPEIKGIDVSRWNGKIDQEIFYYFTINYFLTLNFFISAYGL